MLSSIHPLGERTRGNRWGTTAAYYVVGSIVGGGALGALLGLVGTALAGAVEIAESMVAIGTIAVLVVAALLDLGRVRVPSPDRQVDETWMIRYRSWVYGAGYGFQLGTGVLTFVKSASVYGLWLLVILGGSVPGGLAVGAWFGFVRGLALLSVARVDDPASLRTYFKRMASLAPAAHAVAVAGPLVAVVVVLAGWVLG